MVRERRDSQGRFWLTGSLSFLPVPMRTRCGLHAELANHLRQERARIIPTDIPKQRTGSQRITFDFAALMRLIL